MISGSQFQFKLSVVFENTHLIVVLKYTKLNERLWLVITNDHLSSDSRARIYSELLGDSETSFPLPLASLQTLVPRTVPHILDAPFTCFNSGTCTRC